METLLRPYHQCVCCRMKASFLKPRTIPVHVILRALFFLSLSIDPVIQVWVFSLLYVSSLNPQRMQIMTETECLGWSWFRSRRSWNICEEYYAGWRSGKIQPTERRFFLHWGSRFFSIELSCFQGIKFWKWMDFPWLGWHMPKQWNYFVKHRDRNVISLFSVWSLPVARKHDHPRRAFIRSRGQVREQRSVDWSMTIFAIV